MKGRLAALVLLAWALVTTILKRSFGRGPRGIALFERNFAADRLPRVTTGERAELTTFGRCIACGRCDAGDGERIASSRGAYPGTMALMLASSRSMPDADAAAEAFARVTDDELAAKERLCPADVPMRRIAAFVRAKAAPAGA
jgi:succinate dehydrogenase/fumarate reductase-like Fe-S protein